MCCLQLSKQNNQLKYMWVLLTDQLSRCTITHIYVSSKMQQHFAESEFHCIFFVDHYILLCGFFDATPHAFINRQQIDFLSQINFHLFLSIFVFNTLDSIIQNLDCQFNSICLDINWPQLNGKKWFDRKLNCSNHNIIELFKFICDYHHKSMTSFTLFIKRISIKQLFYQIKLLHY